VTRIGGLLHALIGASLLAFGFVADLSLVAQGEAARAASATALDETARLAATSVRAALRVVEAAVLEGQGAADVRIERLAVAPDLAATPSGRPYARLSRSELAELLSSTASTPNGLPEAVVARLALGEAGSVSSDKGAVSDVGARLLAGELPVRASDLPYLARALGVFDEEVVRGLIERLRAAPDGARLPAAPAFRRTLRADEAVEGWSLERQQRVHYELGVAALLGRAGVEGRARAMRAAEDPPADGRVVAVIDVDGLRLAVSRDTSGEVQVLALRIALWAAVLASVAGLVLVRRAIARETHATAREKAFLAGVTHELRSPVASIRLLGETLAEGRGDAREYGSLVARESERLEGLVERVLSVARVEAAPSFSHVEPQEIVRSVVALLRPRAERRSVSLEWSAEPLPAATWDGEAVKGALVNLVENAIHHGREGGRVVVRAKADEVAVAVSVSDDGPGIARQERRSIFGRFARGRSEASGTGLGLYLVEQVARAHGGRVDLETEEGRGSTFTLVLPLLPPLSSGSPA
jgi:signal transduction histidine kinase